MKQMRIVLLALLQLSFLTLQAQEIGANFNHNPEILEFKYLEMSQAGWIRTTPNIMNYVHHGRSVRNSDQFSKVVEAGNKGYKVAFGFRWHFKENNLNIPQPNSPAEQVYFDYVDSILQIVGPHVDMFKLGNEPQFETLNADMEADGNGEIPLVRFTQRLYDLAVYPYFSATRSPDSMPDIYVGSIVKLWKSSSQSNAAVQGLMDYVQNTPGITGLALHLHITNFGEAENGLKYARTIVPTKPFIVTEFSFQPLFKNKNNELLGNSEEGQAFATKYGRNPNWKLYEYYTYMNNNRVSTEEMDDFFDTRAWFPHHFLLTYYDLFKRYGITFASYPLLQQSTPLSLSSNTAIWFFNPIFCQKNLFVQPNGDYTQNPASFDDYVTMVNGGENNDVELLFHFDFEDKLTDNSANTYKLKGVNPPVYVDGKVGKCVELNGTSDYFDLPRRGILNTGARTFTLCAWVNTTHTGEGAQHILHQLGGRVILLHTASSTESTLGTWVGGASYQAGGTPFQPNEWQHVSIVCNADAQTHTYYINGDSIGQSTSTDVFETEIDGFRVGAHKNGNINFWEGKIDELYLFKGALSPSEIKDVMNDASTLDIDQTSAASKVVVFPNPAADLIQVNASSIPKEITLYSLAGKELLSTADSETLDITQLGAGCFFLHVILQDGATHTQKIMVVK